MKSTTNHSLSGTGSGPITGAELPGSAASAPGSTHWGYPAVVLMLGVALSLGLFATARTRQRAARRIEFERAAQQIAARTRASFDIPLEVVRGVAALFASSEDVTRNEFKTFVGGALRRNPGIYALEWIPRIPGAKRAEVEATAVADGFVGFHFKQDNPPGRPVRAAERAEYFPLYYQEPPNDVALGLEETALETRRVAIERARDLDMTVVTERLRLVQDDPQVASVIGFHPVYRGGRTTDVTSRRRHLLGFAAVVFRIRTVLKDALTGRDAERFDLAVVDLDARTPTALYESHPGVSVRPATIGAARWEQTATIAGRRWAIRVGDRANWVAASDAGWLELGGGLLVSLLVAGCVFALRSVSHLRNQVRAAKKLGQYTLVEKLGEGGMGTVYRAHHALLRRPTALKLLHAGGTHPTALKRFESEVQLTASLTHPNTVVVYDYGQSPDHVFYYAMEYIDGATLQDVVDACGPQVPERVVPILVHICAALDEAHGIGLVHRDIKPANIMLCTRGNIPDFVKVLDFGLVKDLSADDNPDLSRSAVLIGTPLYVAPELAMRHAVDARADLYALGAVAYFLLTGTPVFTGRTVFEICAQHLSAPPESLSMRLGRTLPPELEAIVLRCLAKDPAQRPESALALATQLQGLAIPGWDREQARHWWDHHGTAVQAHVRRQRSSQQQASERTLDVDRSRWLERSSTTGDGIGQSRADTEPA